MNDLVSAEQAQNWLDTAFPLPRLTPFEQRLCRTVVHLWAEVERLRAQNERLFHVLAVTDAEDARY